MARNCFESSTNFFSDVAGLILRAKLVLFPRILLVKIAICANGVINNEKRREKLIAT